jgi:hypothetical protein
VSVVGADEVDLDRSHISWLSPLARALMKCGAGDRVVLYAPGGMEQLQVGFDAEKTFALVALQGRCDLLILLTTASCVRRATSLPGKRSRVSGFIPALPIRVAG